MSCHCPGRILTNRSPSRLSALPLSPEGASQVALEATRPMQEDTGGSGSIPEWGRFPGLGNGNPLQYSYLENPTDRGAWQATVCRVAKNCTQLRDWANPIAWTGWWELSSITCVGKLRCCFACFSNASCQTSIWFRIPLWLPQPDLVPSNKCSVSRSFCVYSPASP